MRPKERSAAKAYLVSKIRVGLEILGLLAIVLDYLLVIASLKTIGGDGEGAGLRD